MPTGAPLPLHVISLARTADRRAEFARRNAHLAWTWFEAVDGHALSREEIAATGHFAGPLAARYTPGAVGCALSHRALWEQTASTNAAITIAEDDAVLRGDFAEASAALVAGLPADWDMVLWGWNFDSSLVVQALPGVSAAAMLFDQQRLRGALADFQDLRDPVLPLRLNACFGMPAYSVSARGAAKLLSLCFPLTEVTMRVPLVHADVTNTGVDVAMNVAYPNLSAWACFPPLAVTPNDLERSTVQEFPLRSGQ